MRLLFLLLMIQIQMTNSLFAKTGPSRIISLTLASDEILLELLQSCGKQSSLLALSTLADDKKYSNVEQAAKRVPLRAGTSLEQVIKLKPDLVIVASYNRKEILDGLTRATVPLLPLKDFSSFDDIKSNIQMIADHVQCPESGKELVKSFQQKLSAVKKIPKPLRILHYSRSGRLFGSKTTFDAIVKHVGAVNIVSDEFKLSYWPLVSMEKILRSNPDVVITLSNDESDFPKNMEGWKSLRAVQAGRVISIDPITSQSVSHYIANAAQELSEKLLQIKK